MSCFLLSVRPSALTHEERDQTEAQYRRAQGDHTVVLEELVEHRCRVVDGLVDRECSCARLEGASQYWPCLV